MFQHGAAGVGHSPKVIFVLAARAGDFYWDGLGGWLSFVDLGAKYATKIGGVNTTFRANVNNLTDEKYWSGVFGSNYAILGAGRTYKLGVTFDF